MDDSRPLSPLASNLRKWLQRRALSQSALARAAQVSKSTVSELERGNGNPSLDTLWSLAQSLNISLGALFVPSSGRTDAELCRLVDAPVIASDEGAYVAQLMASWRPQGEVEVSVVTLAAGAERNSAGNAPDVIERAVCASGQVAVGPVGREQILEEGDMITFRADQPHVYRAGDQGGRLVVVQQYPAMP